MQRHREFSTNCFYLLQQNHSNEVLLRKNFQDGISGKRVWLSPKVTSWLDNGPHSKPSSAPSGTDFNSDELFIT